MLEMNEKARKAEELLEIIEKGEDGGRGVVHRPVRGSSESAQGGNTQ